MAANAPAIQQPPAKGSATPGDGQPTTVDPPRPETTRVSGTSDPGRVLTIDLDSFIAALQTFPEPAPEKMAGLAAGAAAAFSDALGRMLSLALTHGASPAEVVKQLRGIQDGHPAGFGEVAVLSVPDGVARAMAQHYLQADPASNNDQLALPVAGACPDCASELTRQEGCIVCHLCGYSKCS